MTEDNSINYIISSVLSYCENEYKRDMTCALSMNSKSSCDVYLRFQVCAIGKVSIVVTDYAITIEYKDTSCATKPQTFIGMKDTSTNVLNAIEWVKDVLSMNFTPLYKEMRANEGDD